MPTYFVTGATGFIGRHLVERLLEREGDIHVLVREGSREQARRADRALGRRRPRSCRSSATSPSRCSASPTSRRGAARQRRPLLPPRRDLRHDRRRRPNVPLNVGGTQQRGRPRQRARGRDLPPRVLDRRRRAPTRASSARTCSTRARSCPPPYHRTKFESEKIARTQRAGRLARVPPGDRRRPLARPARWTRSTGRTTSSRRSRRLRHALPRVVPADRPRARLDEHRARSTTSPPRWTTSRTSRASTARRSTSSTRKRAALRRRAQHLRARRARAAVGAARSTSA